MKIKKMEIPFYASENPIKMEEIEMSAEEFQEFLETVKVITRR